MTGPEKRTVWRVLCLGYRLGGDEFAVLIMDVDAPAALETLRRGFRRAEAVADMGASCSVGVVSGSGNERADELVRRADALMYRAEAGGEGSEAALGGVFARLGAGQPLGPTEPTWARARVNHG